MSFCGFSRSYPISQVKYYLAVGRRTSGYIFRFCCINSIGAAPSVCDLRWVGVGEGTVSPRSSETPARHPSPAATSSNWLKFISASRAWYAGGDCVLQQKVEFTY